ncbi:MAG: alpha/beta fold hydrolase [Thermaerobacter sp.]|nr:alpha/beta fold hydrolase [Thermaerobacter sp.]
MGRFRAVSVRQRTLTGEGRRVFLQTVEPSRPWASLLFLHAALLHSAYYLPFAQTLASCGIRVWLPDLAGHGRAPGGRGQTGTWQGHLQDASMVWRRLEMQRRAGLLAVGGEGYGALLAYRAAHEDRLDADALVMLAPSVSLTHKMPNWAEKLVDVMGLRWPALVLPSKPPVKWLTKDGGLQTRILHDPLCPRRVPLSLLHAVLEAERNLPAPRPDLPMLSLLSAGDALADSRAAERLLGHGPMSSVDWVPHPGHSLATERPDLVRALIPEWLKRQTACRHGA